MNLAWVVAKTDTVHQIQAQLVIEWIINAHQF